MSMVAPVPLVLLALAWFTNASDSAVLVDGVAVSVQVRYTVSVLDVSERVAAMTVPAPPTATAKMTSEDASDRRAVRRIAGPVALRSRERKVDLLPVLGRHGGRQRDRHAPSTRRHRSGPRR